MAPTLVIMVGGHPWGFRIDGGAENYQPIRITKVLGGGKAYYYGLQVGDMLASINGERADCMTISRARHLIRSSDDRLVLEVMRPNKDLRANPEIRITGTSRTADKLHENQNYKTNLNSWSNTASGIQICDRSDFFNDRSRSVRSPLLPPPSYDAATSARPSHVTLPRSHAPMNKVLMPGYLTSPSDMSRNKQNANFPLNSRNTSEFYSSQVGDWVFTVPDSSPTKHASSNSRSGTESAPIGECFAIKSGVASRKPVTLRPFRLKTVDAGCTDRNLLSTAVVLPLSSTFKGTSDEVLVSKNPYERENQQHGRQEDNMSNKQGQSFSMVQKQNSYNERGRRANPTDFKRQQLEKSWSQTIKDYKKSQAIPDYEFIHNRPNFQQNTFEVSPKNDYWWKQELEKCRSSTSEKNDGWILRQKWDEENLLRKLEMEKVMTEKRQRQLIKEQMTNNAKRNSDYFTPLQRSPFLTDLYTDDEVVETLSRPAKKVNTKTRGKARAMHTFRAQNSRELSFKRNDIVYILRQVDKNWFEGEHHGAVGIFPVTYVEIITSLDEAKANAEQREGYATVMYTFRAQTPLELSLRKGEIVTLIRRVDENWYEGRIDNCQGIFPVSYVEAHREPETPMVTPMSSLAPTPTPGTPTCHSPVSSVCSVGPEIPSAPMSPLDSEFYESDWEAEMLGALRAGQALKTSRPTSPSSIHFYSSDRESTPVQAITSVRTNPMDLFLENPTYTQSPKQLVESLIVVSADRNLQQENTSNAGDKSDDSNVIKHGQTKNMTKPNDRTVENLMSCVSPPPSTSQRPPSGRFPPTSPSPKSPLKAKPLPASKTQKQQTSTENKDQGLSKRSRTSNPNPYSRYRVVYNYKPHSIDELELVRGDIIYVMEKCTDGWFVGISHSNKQFGTFPGNFVRQI